MRMPPKSSLRTGTDDPNAALRFEIAGEQVANLGRLGGRLEAALGALSRFDAGEGQPAERQALVVQAGIALWYFVVQREACGLNDSARVIEDYRVPKEVRSRMGVLPIRTATEAQRGK